MGRNISNTAACIHNLGDYYYDRGDYAAAIPLYQRAVEILEKAFGPEHPKLAACQNSLAELYRKQGNYAAALPLYQRSLAIREKILVPTIAKRQPA